MVLAKIHAILRNTWMWKYDNDKIFYRKKHIQNTIL